MRLKPSDIGECWNHQRSRLDALKRLGFNPKHILDVGAYRGAWSEVVWHTWPDSKYFLVEANEDCIPYLDQTGFPYTIALLSDKEEEAVYNKCQTGSGEGNSLFKEQTHYPFAQAKVKTKLLSSVVSHVYDFIKIDAQGAELLIINGSPDRIKEAHVVQLECQVQNYNAGAPLMVDVINRMSELGFRVYDIGEYHYNSMNMLIQADLIFAQKTSPLFSLNNLS